MARGSEGANRSPKAKVKVKAKAKKAKKSAAKKKVAAVEPEPEPEPEPPFVDNKECFTLRGLPAVEGLYWPSASVGKLVAARASNAGAGRDKTSSSVFSDNELFGNDDELFGSGAEVLARAAADMNGPHFEGGSSSHVYSEGSVWYIGRRWPAETNGVVAKSCFSSPQLPTGTTRWITTRTSTRPEMEVELTVQSAAKRTAVADDTTQVFMRWHGRGVKSLLDKTMELGVPSDVAVADYADYLGIKAANDTSVLQLVRECLCAPLPPEGWNEFYEPSCQ